MKYNTLEISSYGTFVDSGHVDAIAIVIMEVDGDQRLFKKVYRGPIEPVEKLMEVLQHPIDPENFGDTKFLDKIENVGLNFPQNGKGRKLERQTEKLVKPYFPKSF